MRITKPLTTSEDIPNTLETEEEIEEEDDEALNEKKRAPKLVVVYDIVHSSSYQVPVLYLNFESLPSGRLPSSDELYQMVVPNSYKASMQAVGQLGAITLTEHPITGVPAYFVHPCRTREAMVPVLEGKMIHPREYVVLWLGTIGASVALEVPLSLAMRMDARGQVNGETLGRS